ncbi:uncharacterized protein LOC128956853 [Oppia nitens]|uniref:uncharacterized protein LOC128956853 n=1 Tax=Oppia nitens TaxID=1686743 RepID=UPI0023DA9709|nr:uncharacterized protein LOC128956853 [Oppia nitens]
MNNTMLKTSAYRYRQRTVLCFAGITLVAGIVVVSLSMNYINGHYISEYHFYDRDTITKWELGVHIPGLVIQFLGLYGAHKEHEQVVGWYGLLMALFAGLSIVSAIWSEFAANWLLTVLYLICSCVSMVYYYEMRRLRLNQAISQLWQTTGAVGVGGVIPVHTTSNNFVYTIPAATTMVSNNVIGGQSAVIMPTTTTRQYVGNHGGVIQMISPVSMIQSTAMMPNTINSDVYQHGATGGQVYPLNPGAIVGGGSNGGQYAEQPPSYQQSETNK